VRYELSRLNPEQFEEFSKELLRLDGFKNITLNAKGVDGGWDLIAEKAFQVAHGREHTISWLIQCKHTATARALPTATIKEILNNFGAQDEHQGLIIITNSKLPAAAIDRMNDHAKSRHRPVFHWDSTDIEKFLDDNPYLLEKFGLGSASESIEGASDVRVLVLSDGSVFAYQVFESLRAHGFDVRETRVHQFGSNALEPSSGDLAGSFDVAFVFLAETYWLPVNREVLDGLRNSMLRGLKVVFTPFCAWSVNSRVNGSMEAILPVRAKHRAVSLFRLLFPDSTLVSDRKDLPDYTGTFIENQRISFTVKKGPMSSRSFDCSLQSTFEFLESKPEAETLIADGEGNPILVVAPFGSGSTAYLNMCAHNCFTPFPLKSPVESVPQVGRFLADFCLWYSSRRPAY
jgi:hypothetical protein